MLPIGIALGVLYITGARRVRRKWPLARSVAFLSGCGAVAATPLIGGTSFTAHMTEHVVLGMVAPVLFALGAPITLALQATNGVWLRRALHTTPVRVATHPVMAWILFGGTLVALVFSPLLEWSVSNNAVHAVVHAHFLLVGSIFATSLVGVDVLPRPLPFGARLIAVLVAVPFHAFVAVALLSARSPMYPSVYPSLSDQRSAAAVLWASGELLTLAVAGIVFARWWAYEQREAVRVDRRLGSVVR